MEFPQTIKVKELERKHQTFVQYERAWKLLTILYQGGIHLENNVEELLVKRPMEPTDVYNTRCDFISYTNALSQGLGWYQGVLFEGKPAVRRLAVTEGKQEMEDEDDGFAAFLQDADGGGTKFFNLLREVFIDVALYGTSYLLLDLPAGIEVSTKAEEQELLKPYLVRYDPRSVVNWQEDDLGNLLWIIIATQNVEAAPEFPHEPKIVDTWRYYSRTEYAVYQRRYKDGEKETPETAELTDKGNHALADENRVPVYRARVGDGHWLGHRAYLTTKKHFNNENALDWSLLNGALAQLVIKGDYDPNQVRSEVTFLQLPENGDAKYLEPTGATTEIQRQRVRDNKEDVYRQMYLLAQARDTAATPAAQSGVSKEADMTPSYEVCSVFGDLLRDASTAILGDVIALLTMQFTVEITGFDFQESDAAGELGTANKVLEMGVPSETLEKELYKKSWRQALPEAGPDLSETIDREIDAGPTREEREKQLRDEEAQAFSRGFQGA
jgi:hypothetical protein